MMSEEVAMGGYQNGSVGEDIGSGHDAEFFEGELGVVGDALESSRELLNVRFV